MRFRPGPLQDADLLAAIVALGMPASLHSTELELHDRSRRLVKTDPALAFQLVEEIPSSPDDAQRAITKGIANRLSKTAITRWSSEDPKSLAKLDPTARRSSPGISISGGQSTLRTSGLSGRSASSRPRAS